MVSADHKLKLRKIDETLKISEGSIFTIFHEHLNIRELCILFINYLEKGRTINGEYYMALLVRSKKEIAKKRLHSEKEKVFFHQDNALCHKSITTMAKLQELYFELLSHPPFSPDLAFSDYYLFVDLKRLL